MMTTTGMTMPDADELAAPDAVLVRQRWIPIDKVDWAKRANAFLCDHGMVESVRVHPTRPSARHHAQYLMRIMVELRMHQRWELREHTYRKGDGWGWTVEYTPGGKNG